MRIAARIDSYCTYEETPSEPYGPWERHVDSDLGQVRIVTEDEEIAYPAEGFIIADESTHVHIIWINYNSGDSFGCEQGLGEILAVLGSKDAADVAYRHIKEAVENNRFTIDTVDDFGREISINNPAAGYFESMNYLDMRVIDLNAIR